MRSKEEAELNYYLPVQRLWLVFGLTAAKSSMSPIERPAQDSGWKALAGVFLFTATTLRPRPWLPHHEKLDSRGRCRAVSVVCKKPITL